MTNPAYASYGSGADPGRAIGRRTGAWVIDLILYCLVAIITFFPLAQRTEPLGGFTGASSFCTELRESRSVSECIELGDTAWYTTGARSAAHFGVALAWFLGTHVILQGLTEPLP